MKKLMFLLLVAIVTIGASATARTAAASTSLSTPEGASLFEIVRWISTKQPTDHHTGPDGSYYSYQREGSLGFISATPFAGSHALYTCGRTYRWRGLDAIDSFTTSSTNCEGVAWAQSSFLGYVSSSQIPGTVPLYRCLSGQNHFDSIQGCEGYPVEGVLGFVFA